MVFEDLNVSAYDGDIRVDYGPETINLKGDGPRRLKRNTSFSDKVDQPACPSVGRDDIP